MISVIIPVYNVEEYIGYCLESLEKQTYKDFEVILVNDGSRDNSLKVIEEYIEISAMNIRVISQENAGVSVARNVGIEVAKGEYIAFIDSDDMAHPDYLNKHLANIKKTGSDISVCSRKELEENASEYCDELQKLDVNVYAREQMLEKMLWGKVKAGIWSLLCKRSVLGDLKFAVGVSYGEDLEMVWRLISSASSIAVDSTKLYGYRVRSNSAMGKFSPKRLDGMRMFEELADYLNVFVPDFAPLFYKYGVARWVWATMWQAAVASDTYKIFKDSIKPYSPKDRMKKLITYPELKVCISSIVYLMCPYFYYCFVRLIRRKLRNVS